MSEKQYGIADKAWQFGIGCSPTMPCSKRCWARRTTARTVECLAKDNPERAAFYQIALTPDRQQWSGKVVLDEAHLYDPLKWKKPALIASGFHCDGGRLDPDEISLLCCIIADCSRHSFMLLTKVPDKLAGGLPSTPLTNVTIGCSVMNQSEANRMRPAMAELSRIGWRTHVWYEPALGPVDWRGWEFLELMVCGGESGPDARPFDDVWAFNTLDWCRANRIAFWMKQGGSAPRFGTVPGDPKAKDLSSLPEGLRIRELPEAMRV